MRFFNAAPPRIALFFLIFTALSAAIFSPFPPAAAENALTFPHKFSEQTSPPSSAPAFEENRGQFDERVRFFSRGNGFDLFLTATEAVYVLRPSSFVSRQSSKTASLDVLNEGQRTKDEGQMAFALRMKIVGANPESSFAGENLREQRTNYFKGDEANWRTDIPNFGAARFENVYEGVSLVWRGREGGAAQYDFLVAPNADAEQIRLEFEGAEYLEVDADGNLLVQTPAGTLKQNKPFTYQETADGIRQEIESRFVINENQQSAIQTPQSVTFAVGDYDASKPLVIDPTVSFNNAAFSTFLGSFADDIANDSAVDANGNVYVTGRTLSPAFPTTVGAFDPTANGIEDVFVTKINASGTGIVFSTFLGGSNYDEGNGIAVDAGGNVFVTGNANGGGFPTTAGAFDTTFNGGADVFAAKLNAAGSGLIYSTYIGASNIDIANDLAIDAAGNSYLVVRTSDTVIDYPTTAGAFDTTFNGFDDVAVTKLNDTGSALIYSTFLGGGSIDVGQGIAVNLNGEVLVGGTATDDAVDFPTTGGAFDPTHNGSTDFFVSRLSADGSALIFSTFIGGAGIDNANGLAIDNAGNAYITGSISTGFPTTAGAFDTTAAGSGEAGLSKISANGANLVYSTYFGGIQDESGRNVRVDAFGNAYIAGSNFGGDFPITAGAFDTTFNGSSDAVLTIFNTTGTALIYSTYLGGGGADFANDVVLDAAGNVYLIGQTAANAIVFPTTSEALQSFNGGGLDAFVSKFGDFSIGGRVVDVTTGNPLPNVHIALSGQVSGSVVTGADGRFGFLNTVPGEPHSVAALRAGYLINPAIFNIAALNNNRELIFLAAPGSPTGGSGGTLALENLSYGKAENGGTVILTVTRTGTVTTLEPVTVDFQTVGGTAHGGQDFAPVSGILTFQLGETSKTIAVAVVNDNTLEPRENFTVTLSNPTNHADIEPNRETATVHIFDEDLANGDLLISEFRQRGRTGANDEYIKLFNPNSFDVTIQTADGSNGLTLARANGAGVTTIATIPNLVTIPARGHFLLTNNNPNGGFSLIDFPTGRGTTTAVGDRTFAADIPDNSNLILLRTANAANFAAGNLLDAVGFENSIWAEGKNLPAISAENGEMSFVRRLTANGLQDTGSNAADFLLVDNQARSFVGTGGKIYSALGVPAPETSESLRLMTADEVSIEAFGEEIFDSTPVPNGRLGTLTIYRKITNRTSQPLIGLRLRGIDFPTAGSTGWHKFASRPDFRLLSSPDATLVAERLHPHGGGINSILTIDAITPDNPLQPNQSIFVAVRFGVMRYGRHPFSFAAEALQ